VRIAIAHPSAAVTGLLARVVGSVRGWRLAWTTGNGAEAVAHCEADAPDVLLLGPSLSGVDGVEATRRIMGRSPCAILIVAGEGRDAVARVFDGIGAGALDSIVVPWIAEDGRLAGTEELVRKIRTAARAAGVGQKRAPTHAAGAGVVPPPAPLLVAIGASTGGPPALATVLASLPRSLPAAVVVVQHVAARFTGDLAAWLAGQIELPVQVAREGEVPAVGRVTLAGQEDDLEVRRDLTLGYRRPLDGTFYHPSVDVFFRSVAVHWPTTGLAVLLTGMGRDGAEGLLALRKKGWRTVAQDEATSAVYGMPKAAAALRAAVEVLPIDLIGPAIAMFVAARPDDGRGARG
jgi:two-component system response regulator WspF